MKRKATIVVLIISIITVITVTIGTTYSLWSKTDSQISQNNMDVGCFKVTFSDRNISGAGDINLVNTYPMYNEDGMKLTPYKFSIENQCSIAASYSVNIETLNTTTMDETKLDVYFNDSVVKSYIPNVVSGLSDDVKNAMNVARGYLAAGESEMFSLRVWIDAIVTKDTPNVPGKIWNGRIAVNSEATYSVPSFGEFELSEDYITYSVDPRNSKTVSSITCYYGDIDSQENEGTSIGVTACQYPLDAEYAKFIVTYEDGTTESSYVKKVYHEEVIDYGDSAAAMNKTGYNTLQAAIDAVSTDGVYTKITLLKDASEILTTLPGQNIELDLNGHTLSNANGSTFVLRNQGTIEIKNGTFRCSATQGAINNENKGTGNVPPVMKLIDVSVYATGSKQAVYNNGGTLEISGNTYLSNTSSNRAALHNLNDSTKHTTGIINIISAEIVSNNAQAIAVESGTVNVGVKDGVIDNSSITATGKTYGITNLGTFNFYDGVLKGKSDAINGTAAGEYDTGASLVTGTETISGATYKTAYTQMP